MPNPVYDAVCSFFPHRSDQLNACDSVYCHGPKFLVDSLMSLMLLQHKKGVIKGPS